MSNTTPTPSRDAAEGSHFTVEDAGSTTDAADLFQNDTTAGTGVRTSDEDAVASADAVADAGAVSGPGSQADSSAASASTASSTGASAARHADSGTAAHAVSTDSSTSSPAAASTTTSASTADEHPHSLAALAGDESIAHVFDQTNGVIEGIDGDSDGSADSDVRSSAERADENPAFESFADTEAQGDGGADDPRRTGA